MLCFPVACQVPALEVVILGRKKVYYLIKGLTILLSSLAWLKESHLSRGGPLAKRVTWPNWSYVSFSIDSVSYSDISPFEEVTLKPFRNQVIDQIPKHS